MNIKIEVDEAMVRMTYNIIEAHICYEFDTFLAKQIKKTLTNAEQGDFWYSSYLWWLVIDQHYPYFQRFGLKLEASIFTSSNTPIDERVLSFMKKSISAYEFIEQFVIPTWRILICKTIPRVNLNTRDELNGGMGDWYLLKDRTVVIKYEFFDAPFLLPKHPPPVLITLEMGR